MVPWRAGVSLDVSTLVPEGALAVALFGSHARGEATESSDVDVLVLVSERAKTYSRGAVTVSPYTFPQLVGMARKGSLFVRHLMSEGHVLRDPGALLLRVYEQFVAPENYRHYLWELREVGALLAVDCEKYLELWPRMNSLAAYLVRSHVYAQLADRGDLTFSVREAELRIGLVGVSEAVQLARSVAPNYDGFLAARAVFAQLAGYEPVNPFGSTEALVVNLANISPLAVVLGVRLLNATGELLPYDTLETEAGV